MTEQEIAAVWPDLRPWLEASDEQIQEATQRLGEAYGRSIDEVAEGCRLLAAGYWQDKEPT